MIKPRPIATVREVVRCDIAAFLAVYVLLIFWAMMLVLAIYSQARTLPAQAPLYPVYILAGSVTGLCFWSVKVRFDRINLVLAQGKRVTARVERFFAYQVYAQVWLKYKTAEGMADQHLWLPATVLTRRLGDMEEVQLFLPPSPLYKPVIGTLYTTKTS